VPRALATLVALCVLIAGPVSAQDVKSILEASAQAMGATNLKTIEFSGTGWIANVGQSYSLTEDWPRFEVTSYTRFVDYAAGASREDLVRRRGHFPDRGGGLPFVGDQRVTELVSGQYAWNQEGDEAQPQWSYLAGVPAADFRQLDILLTPHGFLLGALKARDAKVITIPLAGESNAGLTRHGRIAHIVSFTALGKYRVNGTINDQNLVELVTTWFPNPVYGDMLLEMRYTEYEDFGGIMFPRLVHEHQGDPVLNPSHNSLEIDVTSVKANVASSQISVPANVRQASPPGVRVESRELADGVWFLGGGSHNSVAVEFRDFVTVVEAPLNEERSLAVIDEIGKRIPGKPIRYLVNTHHHFDHLGGTRTYLAQGATIVTHELNRDYYAHVVFDRGPWTLAPDRLSEFYPMFWASRRPAPIETVGQKYVISDDTRVMDIYPVAGLDHVADMLIVYLPREKILINADLYTPPPPGVEPPPPNQRMLALDHAIERYGLEVDQHVPIHGQPGPNAPFVAIMSRAR
jgi:glyoxylase-like metal-dependent hydrolase (beta-lactamase superfamily II)